MPKNAQILVDLGQGMSLMLGLPTINSWSNATRPKQARKGTFGFNSETNNLEYFTGEYWLGASMSELGN